MASFTWKDVATLTAEEHARGMSTVRTERDKLLKACDFTVLPDAPVADSAAWTTYRQALRDLPEAAAQLDDPTSVTWPEPPAAP